MKINEYFDVPVFMIQEVLRSQESKDWSGVGSTHLRWIEKLHPGLTNNFDKYCRMCPRKKKLSVKIDGKKQHTQKILLLCNQKELYTDYVRVTGNKVSFSNFSQLRPKCCITINHSSGVHSVCVCEIHQNVKLMIAAVPETESDKDLLSLLVCDVSKRDCMLHNCDECPSVVIFREYLEDLFDWNGFDDDEIVS